MSSMPDAEQLYFGQKLDRVLFRGWKFVVTKLEFLLGPYMLQYTMDLPILLAFETAAGNDIVGDYYEFGVWKGRSFTLAYRRARLRLKAHQFRRMKFVAFDSFAGLPESNDPALPSHYHKGAYSAPRELFEKNCRRAGVPDESLVVVSGWYDRLHETTAQVPMLKDSRISICYIDCDIYESAVPVLDYITPKLQVGSLLVIDDWNRHHASSRFGIRRAVKEWQERNPHLVLNQIALTKRVLFAVDFVDPPAGQSQIQ